ncbi:MAG: GNAT family N-acetyltransferase [Candidatus Kapabacteria bacterium]|jgi:GNAT superfamily N-acetyltransferase|nr:GNAT family N-acetyltransferase [Candidatus Kapabacteria bacterium]
MNYNDKSLAERIESAQVQNQYDYAQAYATLNLPASCVFIRVGNAGALYAGAESPLTQSFGLGFGTEIHQPEMQETVLARLEEFFFAHKVAVNIEVANLTPLDLTILLGKRGYTVNEYSHVLGLDIRRFQAKNLPAPSLEAFPVAPNELNLAAEAIASGFLEQNVGESEIASDFQEMFVVAMQTKGSTAFAVTIDGQIAGAGGLTMIEDVAMLSGASTQPKFRNRGVQKALIDARLRFASEAGCDIAVVSTAPGSVSQINMQKNNFQILYARTKFTLPLNV